MFKTLAVLVLSLGVAGCGGSVDAAADSGTGAVLAAPAEGGCCSGHAESAAPAAESCCEGEAKAEACCEGEAKAGGCVSEGLVVPPAEAKKLDGKN